MNIDDLKLIGWTKWEGGRCPVPNGWLTEIMFNDDSTITTNNPEEYDWASNEEKTDIKAYKQLQVGVCQNGDPIIIGGEYDLNGCTVKVIHKDGKDHEKLYYLVGGKVYWAMSKYFLSFRKNTLQEPHQQKTVIIDGVEYVPKK